MKDNTVLTPHFQLREFTESATARKHGIVNEPTAEAVENLRRLCIGTLEPLREKLKQPVVITSGFRCQQLNEIIVHASRKSQHMSGQAADFHLGHTDFTDDTDKRRKRLIQAFRLIITDESIDFDQLILYPNFIHVSYVSKERNRRKITKANGQGTYCALSRAQALSIS